MVKCIIERFRNLKYYQCFFWSIFTIFSFLMLYLFYGQTTVYSDFSAHIEIILGTSANGEVYSLLQLTGQLLSKIIPLEYGLPLLIMFSNMASIMIVRKYFRQNYPDKNKYLADCACIILFIVSMIWQPYTYFYLGTGTPNPWHNPTYLFARPFSIAAFIYFIKLYKSYKLNKRYYKELIWFSLFCFLSAWAKPSFLLVFVPANILFLLYILYKTKGKSFVFSLHIALSYIPSAIIVLIINGIVFSSDSSIVFSPGVVWHFNQSSVLFAVILAMAFPIYMFVHNLKRLEHNDWLAFLLYIFGISEAFFLSESGPRVYDGNFFWGYFYAMFFCFMIAIEKLFFNNKINKTQKADASFLLICHIISGIAYFTIILITSAYS